MGHSKLQHFFWLLAGSEISILRECPNEYNRHANIGMMILITSVFAFFTAYVAGITFVNGNPLGVILFATVWSLLVFSIDRSMVNSIKRDPNATTQPFWSFFIPRLILAIILAFFMSIPLDHIVFPEAIERQMRINVHKDWLNRQEELNRGYDVSERESDLKTIAVEIKGIEDELKSDCPLPDYKSSIKSYNDCAIAIPPLRADVENKKAAASRYYGRLPTSRTGARIIDATYLALRRARDDVQRSLRDRVKECNTYHDEAKRIDSAWRASKQTELGERSSLHTKSETKLNTDKDNIRDDAETFKNELAGMIGFDTKFTTLFLIPNWGVQVLKWAIFLALLVIEILPTYLKLKTPVGQYDRRMQEREDIMINDITARVSSEKDITKQTEVHRMASEIELNKTIINKIGAIELRLAQELLDEWEQKARTQSKKNVADANL